VHAGCSGLNIQPPGQVVGQLISMPHRTIGAFHKMGTILRYNNDAGLALRTNEW